MEEMNKNNNKIDKKNKRKNNKVKRQISIFTIMLWVFLISTMITITVNSTKKINSLEVTDENWNIGLVMFDRSSDTPNEAITDFTWNAENSNERKQLCMQINYACTTNKGYAPGEIEIEIPGIAKDSFSEYWRNYDRYKLDNGKFICFYEFWLRNSVTIAADKLTVTAKKYDWSYSYDEETNIYTFMNNMEIAENEHFEGTIQIVYNLEPKFRIKTNLEFIAKIKENIKNAEEIIAKESNVCNFHYTSTKTEYTLKKYGAVAPNADYTKIEDILDDYYWVGYGFNVSCNYFKDVISAYGENQELIKHINSNEIIYCIKEELPEGCVLYDGGFDKVEPKENNTYYYLRNSNSWNDYSCYVGYPKDRYNEGDKITNTAELWGRYEDEEEMQKLAEASRTESLVAFDFEYKGDLYGIKKMTRNNRSEDIYKNKIKFSKGECEFYICSQAFYTDNPMDVEIGDDLLYITRENGEVTKLEDDEYNFTRIGIPVFYTYNKYSGNSGDKLIGYNYEVQVRYKDVSEYVVYSEGVTSDKGEYITFDREDIVGIKVVIKDLDKTLYCDLSEYHRGIQVNMNIYTENCDLGKLYNFAYLQVYKKDESGNRTLVNEPTFDSYSTESTELKIAEYDIETYGTYMQRSFKSDNIVDGGFSLGTDKTGIIFNNNVKEEKYEAEYTIESILYLAYYDVDKDVIIKQYDILPLGMNLMSTKEEIKNSINNGIISGWKHLKLKDGTVFSSSEELGNYIKENIIIDIDYNYRNSGRTKISIIYNLNELDWSYYLKEYLSSGLFVSLKVEIPYDSILEYGTSYKNYTYAMWNNQEYEYFTAGYNLDNGNVDPLAKDIDEDGSIDENLVYRVNILNITHAVSSQQAVIKQVRTDLTKGKFIEGTAEATAGSEYTYKLRVTTGANSLKDLIIYDTLETIYDENGNDISSGWNGKLLGVDTSYALLKGYAPVVYYSEEKNPGKLTEVPEKWIELTDEVDKTKVKSICVDLRYKADGTEMELSSNNVVFVLINMQAPEDDTIITSANNMFSTNWRAKDPLGTVIDNVEGIYSNQVNVEIHKEDVRTEISGTKTWNDLDNKYKQRPSSITVKLLQDGKEYETKEVTEADNWSYTFENIPVYESNTREYEYEIVEDEVKNYETTYDGYNITNSIKLKDIEVTKIWEDNNNEAGKRPNSITLQIFDGDKLITEAEVNEESGWRHTFTNLLKYREDGSEIIYTVEEKELDEEISKFYIKNIVGNIVTNKFVVPEDRIKIQGKKEWEDKENENGKRDNFVILQLKAGDNIISEAKVSEENNWSYEFEAPKYDELGNEVEYYIDEKDSGNKFYKKVLIDKNTVKNEFVVPEEETLIKAVKKWEDNNNEYSKRPKSVVLQVYNKDKLVVEGKVDVDNNWSYEFKLPKYDEHGEEIEYTVDEKGTPKYYEKTVEGYTVINKCIYEPAVDTSDINVLLYVIIFFITIIGIIVGINIVRKKNKINNK